MILCFIDSVCFVGDGLRKQLPKWITETVILKTWGSLIAMVLRSRSYIFISSSTHNQESVVWCSPKPEGNGLFIKQCWCGMRSSWLLLTTHSQRIYNALATHYQHITNALAAARCWCGIKQWALGKDRFSHRRVRLQYRVLRLTQWTREHTAAVASRWSRQHIPTSAYCHVECVRVDVCVVVATEGITGCSPRINCFPYLSSLHYGAYEGIGLPHPPYS